MKKVGLLLLFAALWLAPSVSAFAQGAFADVPIDHWAYDAIQKLADEGVVIGYPDGTFKGQRAMTRYEFAMAISRLMDKMGDGTVGPAGPEGKQGAPGATGPAGPPGAGALTDAQAALLSRLEKEFMPELKQIRSDLDDAVRRIEALESAAPAEPKLKVSGMAQYRSGWYGSSLRLKAGTTTGYPYDPTTGVGVFATSVPPFILTDIPVTDSMKDAIKANDFSSLKTVVNLDGSFSSSPTVDVHVSLVSDPRSNYTIFGSDVFGSASPNSAWMSGNLDLVRVDEAYAAFDVDLVWPWRWVVGKQRVRWGQGLLLDNNLLALKGVDAKANVSGDIAVELFGSQLDREALGSQTAEPANPPGSGTHGQDTIAATRLTFPIGGWQLGGSWLATGFREETGWSADAQGKIFGRQVSVEYAGVRRNAAGVNTDTIESVTGASRTASRAVLVNADILKTDSVGLQASWGQLGEVYAFAIPRDGYDQWGSGAGPFNLPFSAVHPYAAVNPHDINWVDRPLFLDPTNITEGWQLALTLPRLLGRGSPLTVTYADGDAYTGDYINWLALGGESSTLPKPPETRNADTVWTVGVSKQLAENLSVGLLYGQRDVENVMLGEAPSGSDNIKVLRGQLTVTF